LIDLTHHFADLLIRELLHLMHKRQMLMQLTSHQMAAAASSGTTIYKAIADGIADSYGVMRFTPNRLWLHLQVEHKHRFRWITWRSRWFTASTICSSSSTKRSWLISQGSTAGTVAGLDLVVDPNYTGDNANAKHALIYPSAAMRFHESPALLNFVPISLPMVD
jgi:hypothetical protein